MPARTRWASPALIEQARLQPLNQFWTTAILLHPDQHDDYEAPLPEHGIVLADKSDVPIPIEQIRSSFPTLLLTARWYALRTLH